MYESQLWEQKNINSYLQREEIIPFKKNEEQKQECLICLEKFNSDSFIKCTKSCSHQFCKQCTVQYLKNQIKFESEEKIRCPMLNCKDYIFEQYILNGDLTMDLQIDYTFYKLNNIIKKDPHSFFCPSMQCNGRQVLRKDIQTKDQFIQCKFCEKDFCRKCNQQHQIGQQCKNQCSNIVVEKKEQIFEKKCPQCEKQQGKNSGCNKIKCLQCKQHFCWLCLQKLDLNDNHYDEIEGSLHCRGKLYDLSDLIWSQIWSVIQFLLENKFFCFISVILYFNCNNILSFNGQVCLKKFDYDFFFYDLVLMNIYSEVILFLPQDVEINPVVRDIAIYMMDILLGQTFLYQFEFFVRTALNLFDWSIIEDFQEFYGQIQDKFIVINLNFVEEFQEKKEFCFLFLLIMNIIILILCLKMLAKLFQYEVDYYSKSDLAMHRYIRVKILDLLMIVFTIYISLAVLLYGFTFLEKNIYSMIFFSVLYCVDEKLLTNIFIE